MEGVYRNTVSNLLFDSRAQSGGGSAQLFRLGPYSGTGRDLYREEDPKQNQIDCFCNVGLLR